MQTLKRVIDKAAKKCGSRSEVARRLLVQPQRLYHWETGMRHMPHETLVALALISDTEPPKLVFDYCEEWARKKGVARALGTAAASLLIAAGFAANVTQTGETTYTLRAISVARLLRKAFGKWRDFASSFGTSSRTAA